MEEAKQQRTNLKKSRTETEETETESEPQPVKNSKNSTLEKEQNDFLNLNERFLEIVKNNTKNINSQIVNQSFDDQACAESPCFEFDKLTPDSTEDYELSNGSSGKNSDTSNEKSPKKINKVQVSKSFAKTVDLQKNKHMKNSTIASSVSIIPNSHTNIKSSSTSSHKKPTSLNTSQSESSLISKSKTDVRNVPSSQCSAPQVNKKNLSSKNNKIDNATQKSRVPLQKKTTKLVSNAPSTSYQSKDNRNSSNNSDFQEISLSRGY